VRIDRKTFADQLAFFVILSKRLAAIVGDRRLQGFLPHHRAVHFFRRQAIKVFSDFLVGHGQRFIERFALDEFGQRRGRRNRRTAAESLKARIQNLVGFRIDVQRQTQRIAAADRTHFADRVGLWQLAGIARVQEVILDLVGVIPHDISPCCWFMCQWVQGACQSK